MIWDVCVDVFLGLGVCVVDFIGFEVDGVVVFLMELYQIVMYGFVEECEFLWEGVCLLEKGVGVGG